MHLLCWIGSITRRHQKECPQAQSVTRILRHPGPLFSIRVMRPGRGMIWAGWAFLTFGQISKHLMTAVHTANVTLWVVLVDPRVDGLGAPVFELNLPG